MIATVLESHPDSDAKEELVDFMINLETAERINQIKAEILKANQKKSPQEV